MHIRNVDDLMKSRRIKRASAISLISDDTGVPIFTLTKWFGQRNIIDSMVCDPVRRSRKGVFNREWVGSLRNLEELLSRKVRGRRRLGLKANRTWILSMARQIRKTPLVVQPSHASQIMLSRSWYYKGFLPRSNFSIRRSSNRKQADIAHARPTIYRFHCELFEKFNALPHIDPVYGHFAKRDVFNFDQIPLPFICDGDCRTVDDKGAVRVWCRQPSSGLEKRQATMHLTLCADDDAIQPKPIIIFRGTGKYIMRSSEIDEYDKRVNVLFQKCAWVDTVTALDIVKLYKSDPAFAEQRRRLMLCDNLDAHISADFVDAMNTNVGEIHLLPPNLTHLIQPVDAGPGRSIKYWMGNALDEALDDPSFLDKWSNGKFSAKERRILMTRWAGDAYEKLISSRRNERYFVKTGCLLRIDGHQNAINVQGLPNFSFPDVNATSLVINLDSSDEGSVGDSGLSDFEGSSDDGDLCDKDDSKISDHEEVFIIFDEALIASGTVHLQRRILHGIEVAESDVVVLSSEMYCEGRFGTDPFGEPITKGSYLSVNRSCIHKKTFYQQ
uniref:DDE-1 domain-containing protein n=1 Tax=Spongospora subterranea TaxID=70186 RepID=A0A0H5QHY6_9EUKA|eukprot:CRZ01665.1 hypothetical protein [Spongospora subterranea]